MRISEEMSEWLRTYLNVAQASLEEEAVEEEEEEEGKGSEKQDSESDGGVVSGVRSNPTLGAIRASSLMEQSEKRVQLRMVRSVDVME